MFESEIKDNYFKLTLETFKEGATIEELEQHLKYYEKKEEYLKCAGIKEGIDYHRFWTLFTLYQEHKKFSND